VFRGSTTASRPDPAKESKVKRKAKRKDVLEVAANNRIRRTFERQDDPIECLKSLFALCVAPEGTFLECERQEMLDNARAAIAKAEKGGAS
jgi:hypothetical protein